MSENREWVREILEKVGWNLEKLDEEIKEENKIDCSLDKKPEIIKEIKEKEEDEDVSFYYEKTNRIVRVQLNNETLKQLTSLEPSQLPSTMEESVQTLTPQQKINIYDYCIQQANLERRKRKFKEKNVVLNIFESKKEQNKPKTKLDLMILEREMKRRRASYRNKNVHFSNKKYVEIIREVLSNSMEDLEKKWKKNK